MAYDSLKQVCLDCNGDYWLFLRKWLELTVSYGESDIIKQSVAIFKTCGFRNLDRQFGHVRDDSHWERHNAAQQELNDWLYAHVDPDIVDLTRSREEVDILFHATLKTLFTTLLHILLCESKEEQKLCMQDFLRFVELIKYGAAGKKLRENT